METDPSELLEGPKIGFKIPEVLTVEEIDRIISAVDMDKKEGQRNRAILETLYSCGLRVSELCNLKLSDLYFEEGFIKVEGKGSKQRLVPISPRAIKEIKYWLTDRNLGKIKKGYEDYVFLARWGNNISRIMVFHMIKELAEKTGIDLPYMTAIVVGGSFFGDNLSFISDTTIASTKTQDCVMRDKFRVNFMIVVPAALVVLGLYIFQGLSVSAPPQVQTIEWIKVIPYLIVLGTAVAGVNVMLVLLLGILSTGIIGIYTGTAFFDWFGAMGTGITGMGELIIITLLAGGMLETIRYNGGIDFIISRLTRHVSGKRGAEFSIAALVGIANLCTANNTIAIITTGPIAKDIALRFHLDRRKTASILDTFSCLVQGIIPYGAQMLIASGLAGISPISIIGNLYYPFCMGTCAILAILLRYPRKYSGEG